MLAKIKRWYKQVVAWLGVSEPGARKELVEDTLTEGVLKDLIERMIDYRDRISSRKRFPQILPDGSKPSDRKTAFAHGLTVPRWGKVSIDEVSDVDGKSFSLNFWVTETDNSEWVLRVMWKPGAIGENFVFPEWEEVVDVI